MPTNRTESQRRYDSAHCRYYYLKYNIRTDADVIEKLESVKSKQDYIRQLIRSDIGSGSSNNNIDNKKEDLTMEKTVYTALINANDGIHIIRKAVSDEHGAYEDFEYYMQNKAADLDGELFGPYCDEDIVEDATIE